jgi:predicted metalloprotease
MLRGRESSNIEDVRGMGGKGLALGGGGLGTIVIALAIYLCGGGDALNFFNQITGSGGAAPTTQQQPQQQPNNQARNDEDRQFALRF